MSYKVDRSKAEGRRQEAGGRRQKAGGAITNAQFKCKTTYIRNAINSFTKYIGKPLSFRLVRFHLSKLKEKRNF